MCNFVPRIVIFSMKKSILITVAALFCHVASTLAIPAYPAKKRVTLTNGNVVNVTLTGDEHFSYFRTDDGKAVRQLDNNQFELIPTFEFMSLQEAASEQRQAANTRRQAKAQRRVGTMVENLTGTKKGLVILVNFKDNNFTVDNPNDFYTRYFNEKGFSDYGFKGSVGDYFREQSYGKFNIDFDVAGPYTLPRIMQWYGAKSSYGHDSDAQQMILDALKLANPDVDFTKYDWNGDKEVDQVFVIYAGYGENYGYSTDCIWPHESHVSVDYDGMHISTYGCSCELQSEGIPDGIGSPCHEFSHCLGYPDMYDTVSQLAGGTAGWDLMCSGSYNGAYVNGRYISAVLPACYTSYERMEAKWLTPVELKSEEQITGMKSLYDSPEAYILRNEGNPNEYFLLENRQQKGFDQGLGGHGLLVLHVDYSESAWASNSVNVDANHRRMDILAADGTSSSSMAGDPFPGPYNVKKITNYTSPAAFTMYNKNSDGTKYLNKNIEHITESNGLISFLACRPDLEVPVVGEPAAASATSFTANWDAVKGADVYELELTETPTKNIATALMLSEDFAGCYKSSNGFTDIGSNMNKYCSVAGFNGSKLYQSPYNLKIGTNTANGDLMTPVLDVPSTTEATIVMGVIPAKEGTETTGVLKVYIRTTGTPAEEIKFKFSTTTTLVLHTSVTVNEYWKIDVCPEGVMYLNNFQVYDGNFSAEELGLNQKKAPRRVKVSTIKETGTSHTFSGLDANCIYTLRVRALDSERESLWSESKTMLVPTPVESIEAEATVDDRIYDLNGREIRRPCKGIYIKNGKKYFVK